MTSSYLLTAFVYISAKGSILFWQLRLIDLGKEFGIFIREEEGEEGEEGGETVSLQEEKGSNVALYLARGYSRKSN